jgi:1-acyl-sn-glycerol-3-phosphate acyltransferase
MNIVQMAANSVTLHNNICIMGYGIALIRFMFFIIITQGYILYLMLLHAVYGFRLQHAIRLASKWSKTMLWLLNIRVELQGSVPEEKVLFLPNHRSYIDAVVTCAYFFSSYVIKAEVGRWPLIGYGTRIIGSILVDRNSRDSRKETREKIAARLAEGYSVVVFPEGTTYEGPGCLELKPGTFQLAAEGQIPIVPVAIEYEHTNDAWIGDDSFIPHFFRCFSKPVTRVKMRIGRKLLSNDAEWLRQQTYQWLNENLLEMKKEFNPHPMALQEH